MVHSRSLRDLQEWDATENGAKLEGDWNSLFAKYKAQYPELASEFERRISGKLPVDFKAKAKAWVDSLQHNEDLRLQPVRQVRLLLTSSVHYYQS